MNLQVFDRFPVLTTARMTLRELDPADADAVFALRADPETHRYQPLDAFPDVAAARAQIARWRRRFALKAEIRWAMTMREDGAFVGSCAFDHFVPWLDRGHLVYEVTPRARGAGLATEAVRAVSAFGHGEAGLHRVEALVMPGNEASARVLRKACFTEEGLLRAYVVWQGRHLDMRMFSSVPEP